MVADGAYLRGKFANDDVPAVAAFPNRHVLGDEDDSAFDVLKELFVAFLVMFFNGRDHAELGSDFFKAFFLGDFGEFGIHGVPFIGFAFSRFLKVFFGGFDVAAF